MILQEIGLAVQRIQKMEKLYDFLLDSKVINSDQFDHSKPGVREAEQILFDYYSNGDWLNDYDLEKKAPVANRSQTQRTIAGRPF